MKHRSAETLSVNKFQTLADLIDDFKSGKLGRQRILYKVEVIEIDPEGGKFTKSNPPRSIRGKILSEQADRMTDDKDIAIYWPLFSEHVVLPIKCGEIVWCVFDDIEMRAGWWMDRVRDDRPEMLGADKRADIDRTNVKDTPFFHEQKDVPLVGFRPDDCGLRGDGGQYLRLGRDRIDEKDSGGDGNIIDLVIDPAGKEVDIKNDKVRFLLASKSNNQLEGLEDKPIGVLIADNVLVIARNKLFMRAEDIEFGGPNNLEPAARGQTLVDRLDEFWRKFVGHLHGTPVGPTTVPVDSSSPDAAAVQNTNSAVLGTIATDLATHVHPYLNAAVPAMTSPPLPPPQITIQGPQPVTANAPPSPNFAEIKSEKILLE